MKTVYYIIGPTASGKTTLALKLSEDMRIPVFHADTVYNMISRKIKEDKNITLSAETLTSIEKWNDPKHFGLRSWGAYGSLVDLKRPLFKRLIKEHAGDFIIEGFTLSHPSERKLVADVVGKHRAVILRLELPFAEWKKNVLKKHKKKVTKELYKKLLDAFVANDSDTVYTITSYTDLLARPAAYQNDDFTHKKIAALKIPIVKGDVVNDVGCNDGFIGEWCLAQGAKKVYGYDRKWRYLDNAQKRGTIPMYGDIERKNMKDADVTLCVSTFHYFTNPQAFLDNARKHTRRLFVLEIPILNEKGKKLQVMDHNPHTRYTPELIEDWLLARFGRVEMIGLSVPPDQSTRYIWHCKIVK